MSLLSLFMTSTGIFCFVPISQRLVECGIIPHSPESQWRLQRPPVVPAPTSYPRDEERIQVLLADDDGGAWSEVKIPRYSPEDTFDAHQLPATPGAKDGWSAGAVSPYKRSPSVSTSFDAFYEHGLASFVSDSTLCDNCNTLLRHEIPPDHIPSVIRAFALFEAQDLSPDMDFNECEVLALTNAFSMLRL